ncbi:rab9 effector protein with kelch motifs [Pelomyxa schiedti]|nr:rab9 effector protein with kelch motifs [Pelomyxa schiedti]
MFVFGGWNGDPMNDLFAFDLEAKKWSQPDLTGKPPPARAGHTMHTVTLLPDNKSLLLIGGGDEIGISKDDCYILDIERLEWRISGAKVTPPTAPTKPCRRWGHSATSVPLQSSVVVFGGNNSEQLSDLDVLDIRTMEWRRIPPVGTWPQARAGHTMTLVGDNLLFLCSGGDSEIFSDMLFLDTSKFEWTIIPGSGPARCVHSSVFYKQQVVLFGGTDGNNFFQDLLFFDLSGQQGELSEMTRKARGQAPPTRIPSTQYETGSGSQKTATLGTLTNTPTSTPAINITSATGSVITPALPISSNTTSRLLSSPTTTKTIPMPVNTEATNLLIPPTPEQQGHFRRSSSSTAINIKAQPQSQALPTDTSAWLSSLGFGCYCAAFANQNIEPDILPMLTDEHLERVLGISRVGHRLTLLAEIHKLKSLMKEKPLSAPAHNSNKS